MPLPQLSQDQIDQLTADREKQVAYKATMTASLANKQARIIEMTISDSSFKTFFNFYNDDIIGQYEAERRAIDGQYIASPITEADVLGPATVDGSVRTTPVMPQTDIVRVDEFDGGPLVQEPTFYEQNHIADQADVETRLTTGFANSGTLNLTTKTTMPVTSSTTLVSLTDSVAWTLNPNDYFCVTDGITATILKTISVAGMTMVAPFTGNVTVEVVIPPVGTIPTNSDVKKFLGFNNAERTAKDATDNSLQPIMDALIVMLSEQLGERMDRMDEQETALNANQDLNQTDITSAKNDIQLSKSFINGYLPSMDISNTGITALTNNRNSRSSFLITRLSQIASAASGYYDQRYDMANNRANTSRGTLRLQKATEGSLATSQDLIQAAQDQIDAIDQLLGL